MHKIQWCSKLLCPTHYCILHNNVSTLDFNLYNNIPSNPIVNVVSNMSYRPMIQDANRGR
jgi:hypothetical protein